MKGSIETVADARRVFDFSLKNTDLKKPKIVKELCNIVLKNDRFWTAPASVNKHHSFEGGLAVHTAQVFATALTASECYYLDFKFEEVLVASVWHDYMKIQDYKYDGLEYTQENGKFVKTRHYALLNHLAASAMEFRRFGYDLAVEAKLDPMLIEHIILSHHGRKEWGSPVEPKTPEAWVVHSADMLSSQF